MGELKEIESLNEEEEQFKNVGQIMFKTTAGKDNRDLNKELELLGFKINFLKKKEESWKNELNEKNKSITNQ